MRMDIQEVMEEMSRPSPRSLLLASVSLLVAVHLWLWIQRCRNADGPPGPFPWPVIGNAAQLGSAPHLYFSRMAQKYGEVFQIKLGSRAVVVLNGDAIRTALIKKGADFAGRPDFTSFQFVSNGKSMAFGNYSDWWKAHRKIAQTTGLTSSTGVFLDKEYVPPTVSDIFGASQDTLSTALQWIILVLVRFPDIQKQLREEVDKVVDSSRLPSIEDQPRLPYVMAFLYEVMRFTSFIPLTIPHSTTTDTAIQGYRIPKDTVVFINQWSINHSPAKWVRPEVFDPNRFLDKSGALDKDQTSSVLIFSLGKRRCIGEDLSKMQLFLYTTLLIHQCLFKANPAEPLSLDYLYGLTLKPKAFNIAVEHRNSMALLDAYVQQHAKAEADGESTSSEQN
ncbi:hypothetical protein ANANG_G00303540 [Anguilla anguilla]|uniref:Unspecific monooxygenase n=1 Tax=Anguilla anguilla TaxID=7936 RepID=A0A9D3RIQ8_ANGAN|nr:hypothetical protein ANANG_G00303540 [Anguilla anguilla]